MLSKKILHITPNGLGNAGVPSVILSIVSNLHNQYQFGCTVYKRKLGRENEFTALGGKLHRINILDHSSCIKRVVDVTFRGVILFYNIYKICKKEKYDVIHCHMGWESAFCLLGAKIAGVKSLIVHAHNPKTKQHNFVKAVIFSALLKIANFLSTKKIGCSEQTCITNFRKDYQVVNNAIDLTEFTYNETHSKEHVKLIHVGRFDYQKNQEFVLDILAELVKIRSDISLSLVGFGVNEQMLCKKVEQLQLEQYVSFVDGTKADVAQLFHDSDYMIFPSRFEGFGIVLLEAQASGVYCFVSDAVQDVTNVGLWEKISLDDSAETWARKILYRMEHGNNVTKIDVLRRLQQFDIKEIAKQYTAIYNE